MALKSRTSRGLATACTLALLLCLPQRAPAQAQPLPPGQPKPGKISEEDLKKLRMLELKSGARTKAAEAPEVQTLKGAPLNDREKVIHVLNRLAFGPRPGEVDKVLAEGGWEKWVEQQLTPDKVEDAALEDALPQKFPWVKMSIAEMRSKYKIGENTYNNPELRRGLPNEVLYRAVMSNRQFQEVMCDFWRNHFFVNLPVRDAPARSWTTPDYERNVVRRHVFGKFRNMLYASATHPAMLEYLDNHMSRANAWNENYAREVMELHTLGADRYYNENDVLELSKALTGWTYDRDLKFVFRQDWHQAGTKKVLGRMLPPGKEGGEQALDMLARHPGCAQFISEKLCRYLVNDNPPAALVRKVASTFRESGGDLPKVYRAIIMSPEFLGRENYRAKFRTPFEFTVAALRSTNARVTDATETCAVIAKMGEPLYDCEDPTGFYDEAEAWMDAGVLTTRWDYAWKLVRGSIGGAQVPPEFLSRYSAGTPEESRDKMVHDLVGSDIGDRTAQMLSKAAEAGDRGQMLSVILGSPDFQQQ